MSTTVTTEQATVYRAAGRRFFTKRAAYRALAIEQLKAEMGGCDCTEPEPAVGFGGDVCEFHAADPFLITVRARSLMRAALAEQEGQDLMQICEQCRKPVCARYSVLVDGRTLHLCEGCTVRAWRQRRPVQAELFRDVPIPGSLRERLGV